MHHLVWPGGHCHHAAAPRLPYIRTAGRRRPRPVRRRAGAMAGPPFCGMPAGRPDDALAIRPATSLTQHRGYDSLPFNNICGKPPLTSCTSSSKSESAGRSAPPGPIRVNGTGFEPDYRISGGGAINAMRTNPREGSLVMEMAASKDGFVEMTLPRAQIDSRSADDTDGPFLVLVDGRAAPHQETGTTDHSRTLRIEFGEGSGTIEVVGTWASVHEFVAAAMVLTGAMAAAA